MRKIGMLKMNELKPDLSPFCMRARGFISQGRIDDALGMYDDVLQVDSTNAMAYADRGTAYAMLKKFDLALIDLERAIALGYVDASTYGTVATIYFELKRYEDSLDNFAKAIELDSNYLLAYYNRSNVFHELGEIKSAIADLKKCLVLNPDEGTRKLIIRRLDSIRVK
ncbi:tetratricopeptide repeat protein [Janthinobacterium sp. FT14W]|nr:tetratricopeptide repeat protein [Janthinobacterium sp. FT14W]